ncbi:MAG: hypothetical protein ACNA8W_07840 [Bradymonadaceae bacterium]
MARYIEGKFRALVLVFCFAAVACSGDPDPVATDAESPDDDVADVGFHDVEDEDVRVPDADAARGNLPLCAPCENHGECGSPDDYCVNLFGDERFCGQACAPGEGSCPQDYFCGDLEAGLFQCIPRQLTCVDHCAETTCSGGQICDPLSGECVEGLGLCETGCLVDGHCVGDGSLCVGSGALDNESFCATGCDASSDTRQCPVDYLCISVDPDNGSPEGICYPLKGTCVDRCAEADCPAGTNCNPLSGSCTTAIYGSCERGCANHSECGGQNDLCFDLGIGQGPHCWTDCSQTRCADGYDCVSLQGTTIQVCIPEVQSCASCYDESCFPDGVCHPDGGACMVVEPDCNIEGCSDEFLCDPVSGRCVEPDRACSGNTWAADCDNVVTRCTTQRANTAGVCAQICTQSSDCLGDMSCIQTNHGRLCLDDDLGGHASCATLYDTSNEVGRPCGTGATFCRAPASQCITAGNLAGFCSMSCTEDTDCGPGASCATGPGGTPICLPVQCECAGHLGISSADAALDRALKAISKSQCALVIDAGLAGELVELDGLPLGAPGLSHDLSFPLPFLGRISQTVAALDIAEDSPVSAFEASARQAGFEVTGEPASTTFDDPTLSALTQAVIELIEAGSGTPDTAELEAAANEVPESFQAVAAPIIRAVADALIARNDALDGAGLTGSTLEELFDHAPHLFLPGTVTQEGGAPDLSDPDVQALLNGLPLEALTKAAADLAATIEAATRDLDIPETDWSNFSYVVDTPTGKVILGDTRDTVYDPTIDSTLQGPIAVLIDAGGDDTYLVDAGANTSAANGVSLLVDLGGHDTYGYVEVSDPLDGEDFLTSDAAGRKTPAGALSQHDGPVSLSTDARQGAGRFGIGMLIDLGDGDDTYQSLRMSQGASVFGVGLLFDSGGEDIFEAEALSQGAAIGGLAVLWSVSGDDHFRIWHAGQGFGTASGTGVLFNREGADTYEAVPGQTNGRDVLYFSPAFAGRANRNLAQGASTGLRAGADDPGLGGGLGILRDVSGNDIYSGGTYTQGYGSTLGVGVLADASGDDRYRGLGSLQGVGEWLGAGILIDESGNDVFNDGAITLQNGQGTGYYLGWGVFAVLDGNNAIQYMAPAGGAGLDGGMGLAIIGPGDDTHIASSASWGFAARTTEASDPVHEALTLGFFFDLGGVADDYQRADITGIGNDELWRQPDPSLPGVFGVGVDMP